MRNKEKALLLLSVGIALLLPTLALAAGLVPCNGIDCNLCSLGTLIQHVINFLIEITIPLFAVLFAWAGFLIFTSAEDPGKIKRAKEIFADALIGFAITLSGWLVVQTILSIIIDKSFWIGGNWNQLECVSQLGTGPGQRLEGTNISDVLNNVLGTTQTTPSGITQPSVAGTSDTGRIGGTNTPSTCQPDNPACSPATLMTTSETLPGTDLTLNQARALSCIAMTESTGRPYVPNPKNSSACGTFQILSKNWNNSQLHFGTCNADVSCNDPACNTQSAILLFHDSGYKPWTTYSDNTKSQACVDTYDPQQ